jgi:integrase
MQLRKHVPNDDAPPLRTLGDVIPEFIEKHARPKNRDWRATASILQRFQPLFHKPLAEIKRADVVRVLDSIIAEGKPYRANRVLAAIKKLFAWALDRGLIEVHPIFGLKPPSKETARDRILTDAEIRGFWTSASGMGFPFGPALLLLLLTGQRRGEVTTMRWSDVDLQRAVWTVPAATAKNGRVHEVPCRRPSRAFWNGCLGSLPPTSSLRLPGAPRSPGLVASRIG